MSVLDQSSSCNRLLGMLSPSDFAILEPIALPVRHIVSAADQSIEYVYFIETGVVSVVAKREDGSSIEAGIIGREGFCNISVLLGVDQSPHESYMQVAGHGYRTSTSDFRNTIRESPAMHSLLSRFVQVFITQTAQTTLANGISHIDQRLARWLLMCNDRMDGNSISITHEFLSMMLGVRRAGVTDTVHIMEGQGLITAARGTITIRDRAELERLAGASYGVPEAEYRRLICPL